MYYEINIAKQNKRGEYHHYFATARRSVTDRDKLKSLLADFMEKYPEPEFNISVSYVPEVSVGMGAEEYLKNPEKLTMKF